MGAGPGTLTLVATPIGNLGDMTYRAVEVLKSADVILCEDTRHSRRLLDHYAISKPLLSYHDHNETRVTPSIISRLLRGDNVALVTDAGTPGVSDPGFFLVRAALEAGIFVTMAPGANAVLPALVPGFPCEAFVFAGLRRESGRTEARRALENDPAPLFCAAPHKVLDALAEIARATGHDRAGDQIHEEVARERRREVRDHFAKEPARRIRRRVRESESSRPRRTSDSATVIDGTEGR
jgi:16S rRNA (cytidine1402-2'-O)-methyltransferase